MVTVSRCQVDRHASEAPANADRSIRMVADDVAPNAESRRSAPRWIGGCPAPVLRLLTALLLVILAPSPGWPCACGCGVFEVGTPSLIPTGSGGMVWTEYDFQNQNKNYSRTSPAPPSQNDDKELGTNFVTLGAQYMFNRDWGAMLTIPYAWRYFSALQDDGEIGNFNWTGIGDIRVWGMYTGLSEDMSTGLLAGIKTPSGLWTYPNADRDTQIGTGSTDLLLGAYHLGTIPGFTFRERPFIWYTQLNLDQPLWVQANYTPGTEFNGALGAFYNFGSVGPLDEVAPGLTLKGTWRGSDSGGNANPDNTGYGRMLLAPGAELGYGNFRLYAAAGLPIFEDVTGNQIVAQVFVTAILSYAF